MTHGQNGAGKHTRQLERRRSPMSESKFAGTLTLLWQFKGTFRGISVGYEFRIGKAKRRRYLWKRKNCQSSAKAEVADFIRKLGCEAIILHELPNRGRTIISKFREAAADVGFAVILMTPDDRGGAVGGKTR